MVKEIIRDELIKMFADGEKFKLLDVLSKESYRNEHIQCAISLPLNEIEKKAAPLLKKDEKIVVYCASFNCQASTKAAEKLLALGYKNVLDYKGGLADYKAANLPLEGALHKVYKTACAC